MKLTDKDYIIQAISLFNIKPDYKEREELVELIPEIHDIFHTESKLTKEFIELELKLGRKL